MKTTEEQKQVLVKILARIDGLFWPCREWDPKDQVQQVLVEHRRRFFEGMGVAWHSSSRGAESSVNMSRLLADMESEGLVKLHREKTKIRYAMLPAKVEDLLRNEGIGLTNRITGLTILQQLAALEADGKSTRDPAWPGFIAETDLTGCNYNDPDPQKTKNLIWETSRFALYAVIRGWVEFLSSSKRHGYYRILPAGRKLLDEGFVIPADDDAFTTKESVYNPDYDEEIASFQSWLRNQNQECSGEIQIPLPCSMA